MWARVVTVFAAGAAIAGAAPHGAITTTTTTAGTYINVTGAPCFLDNTGQTDVTRALQACIVNAFQMATPSTPLFFPLGTYLLSDTIVIQQTNGGKDDGINVVPCRFAAHNLIGAKRLAGQEGPRPTFVLAANSSGFASTGGNYKPLFKIFNSDGEGVDMNNVFMGLDLDLTREGNPGAVGISHPGAQGATVQDVTVTAAAGTFACFAGMNGAGGFHANIKCIGARYGVFIDDSQPVPVAVGATFINQSISAIVHQGQEMLSLVGATIVVPAGATGPAIHCTAAGAKGMSLIDVAVSCASGAGYSTAVETSRTLYARDLYVSGCGVAIKQDSMPTLPGPGDPASWLHVQEWAKGTERSKWYNTDVVYLPAGPGPAAQPQRVPGGNVSVFGLLPQGASPPADRVSQHLWEEDQVPGIDSPGAANAKADCGAVGDNVTDDTPALQRCLDAHQSVVLPPGLYRISATLRLGAGASLMGMGNTASVILAASGGFPAASATSPQPMLRTPADDTAPVTIGHIGVVTWHHLPHVFTLDWLTRHPASVWRSNFESRDCECLWVSAYQQLNPTAIPCQLPTNITIPKSQFRGLGRVYGFVNDDTGTILSTGATFRNILIADTAGFASPTARLRLYSANLEHTQAEANMEVRNATFIDIYSMKSEGNGVVAWIRNSSNVSILGFGGGISPFAFNVSYPSDFVQRVPSIFRVDSDARDVKFAALLDHGYGAVPPYWPPTPGGCKWGRHYPYPGTAIDFYPFTTFPNGTMWSCWFGDRAATSYWYIITLGDEGTAFTDKPVLWLH